MFLHHCQCVCSMSEDRPVFNDSAIMCPGHGFVLAERRRSRGCNVSWLLHLVALQARIVNLSFIITPVHTAYSRVWLSGDHCTLSSGFFFISTWLDRYIYLIIGLKTEEKNILTLCFPPTSPPSWGSLRTQMMDEKLSITLPQIFRHLLEEKLMQLKLSFLKYFISRSQTFPYTESGNKSYFSNHFGTTEYYLFQSEIWFLIKIFLYNNEQNIYMYVSTFIFYF